MFPFVVKDADTLRTEMVGTLNALGIGNRYEGGVAKGIMDGCMDKVGELYAATEEGIRDSNLSTTGGSFLDLRANSLGLNRIMSESDNSLRFRVGTNILNRQMCNEAAIDTRLRAHPRVKEVTYADYIYGSGSFVAFIDPLDGTSVDSALVLELQDLLRGVVARGTKFLVMGIKERSIRIVIAIRGKNANASLAVSSIEATISLLSRGDTLFIDRIRAAAVNAGADHVDIKEIYLDGQRILPRDIPVGWDEKVVVDRAAPDPIQVIV